MALAGAAHLVGVSSVTPRLQVRSLLGVHTGGNRHCFSHSGVSLNLSSFPPVSNENKVNLKKKG